MSKSLTVIEQKEVTFYDDTLTAVRGNDSRVYVSVRHMCDALGIDTQGQTQRIDRHTILSEGKGVCDLHTPGGLQSTIVLRVDLVPLWLSGIRTSAIRDNDTRQKLEKFQREAAAVLWEAFQDGRLTSDPSFDELLQSDSDAVQAYKMAMAVARIARSQILLESRVDAHEQRLEAIESELGSGHKITPDQATSISQAVKAVARELGKQTKRNEYGGVYGELYRRYRIPSYKKLPTNDYDDCMTWLGDWLESLTGDEAY